MPPRISTAPANPSLYANHLDSQRRTSPCEAACPAGVPIQKLTTLVKDNQLAQALRFLRSRNPFSSLTGRVCNHPCEAACNRAQFDEALSIRALERYASDLADLADPLPLRNLPATGRRIAVVGSGPAGMTCAYFSALLGHRVTVFEASPYLGGMARAGIPDFRLPKNVLDREIERILALGIEARTGTAIGTDVALDTLLAEYDACVIAAGAWKERKLDLPGAEHAESGLTFLKRANLGERNRVGRRVVIIGGGGVAFDCAFTAKRLGADDVHIICLEKAGEMRATPEDIRQGEEERIKVHNSAVVASIAGGPVSVVEIAGVSGFEFHADGKVTVQIGSDRRERVEADMVIAAVGVEADIAAIDPQNRIKLTDRGTIAIEPGTLSTSLERVYAAGDVVTGPGTVAQAVGAGRLAAVAINNGFLGLKPGQGVRIAINDDGEPSLKTFAETTQQHAVTLAELMNRDLFVRKDRQRTTQLPGSSSVQSFEERDTGMDGDQAVAEAERCFHCGQCQSCGNCVEDCPGYVLVMSPEGPKVAYPEECWHCGNCRISCPSGAVEYEFPVSMML